MNNILAQLNSVPMYAICGGIIAFVDNSIKSYVNGNPIACCGGSGCFIANVIRSFGKSRRFAVPARFR